MLLIGPPMMGFYGLHRFGRVLRVTDEYFYHAHARSWYFDHDCEYKNDMLMAPGFESSVDHVRKLTPTGYVRNYFFCGTSMVSFPLIALGDAITIAHNAITSPALPRDGYSYYYQLAIMLGHTLLGAAGLLAIYLLCARFFSPMVSAWAVLCVWLGTSAIYYVGFAPAQSHGDSLAFVAFILLLTDTIRRNGFALITMIGLGFSVGMAAIIRPQDAVWALVPIVALMPMLIESLRNSKTRNATMACSIVAILIALACYIPQMIVHYRHYGKLIYNQYAVTRWNDRLGILAWGSPDFMRNILDPKIGFFWTAPIALIALTGAVLLIRKRLLFLTAITVALAVSYYVLSCTWWYGDGYGNRYTISWSAAFALGLCVVFAWASKTKWRLRSMATLATGLIVAQITLFAFVNFGVLKPEYTSVLQIIDSPH